MVVQQEENESDQVISWRVGLLWLTNKTTNKVLIKMEYGF
jgi:hypothetical protein